MIRINKDGTAPKDNPYSMNEDWLPEIYQIGLETSRHYALSK